MSLPGPPDTLLSRRHRLPCARKTRSTFTFKAWESRNLSPTSMVPPAIEAGVAGVSTALPNVANCLDIRAVCGACLCKLVFEGLLLFGLWSELLLWSTVGVHYIQVQRQHFYGVQ